MRQVMVRYKVKPERVEENEELVRAVYDELGRTEPAGLRYATFKLDDGVSFVHLAVTRDRGRRHPAVDADGVPGVPEEHRGPQRRAPGRHRAGADRLLPPGRRFPRALRRRCRRSAPTQSSISSCTPLTCRAPAPFTRSSAAGARSGSRRDPAPTSRSSSATASGAASSSAACGARSGCPTSRSRDRRGHRARPRLGASVLLEPREGPAGWRSVVATPAGGEIAFWQPKARRQSVWGTA